MPEPATPLALGTLPGAMPAVFGGTSPYSGTLRREARWAWEQRAPQAPGLTGEPLTLRGQHGTTCAGRGRWGAAGLSSMGACEPPGARHVASV